MSRPELDLTTRPLVMGILNVTPDSFSDGGEFFAPERALRAAAEMVGDGADLIDVGGESSRPGAEPVGAAEQIRRTQEIIAAIHGQFPALPISIDTQLAEVAAAALDAGASMVNDISALRGDAQMAKLVARRRAYVVLMHMQGSPRTMQLDPHYDNVVAEVRTFLEQRVEYALANGIDRGRIIIDPGVGFGKTVDHNLQILAGLNGLVSLAPVLLGASRKSFIGKVLGIDDPRKRQTGTIVANTIGLLSGVRVLRVHEVREARQTIELWMAMNSPSALW